ncbi:dihydrouridine synthase-domain-containing protein [Piptocephalis cylindrospora]|uniref:tRNA-dihydrouridine(16/17) synthase [NAD(P)(+)] n=1 Tax=Piptocephalis cylindrospora TaxID=1907219 RepID=A0A4P9Y2S8_9FUNG|nr:dihydrouridine synthase-domain-containing protein [Piptocephalis cylindrospora]|eukprot:RKP13093.1 dihydrouridine synthase-domain-containing protein [Piptocephalis cylindrospora]
MTLTQIPPKLEGFEFWEKTLRGAKHVMAPMVDQSEHAWRRLCRRYGTELCYTPMLHARLFAENEKYRKEHFTTDPTDRPLIVQFCANDPDTLLTAAKYVEGQCDAVDLNLGCPQDIARRGHYGSFLQEDWDVIAKMVSTLHKNLAVPVTVKIRIFPELERTLAYAKMIQDAGAQLLGVHGRVREQRGHNTGLADWEQIRAVRESLSIPVIANGNILEPEDVPRCLEATGAVGVMSAEGNLYNPAIFAGLHPEVWKMGQEYLEICRELPTRLSSIRGHLFKLYRPCLAKHTDLRDRLGRAGDLDALVTLTAELAERLQIEAKEGDGVTGTPRHPHWLCQPYVRPPMAPPKRKGADGVGGKGVDGKGVEAKEDDRKKRKKESGPQCSGCKNGASPKCQGLLCRKCCRATGKASDCPAHQSKRRQEEGTTAAPEAIASQV